MDLDDFLELILTRTLFLWLLPYIFWYFSRLLIGATWNWVTEPEQIDEGI